MKETAVARVVQRCGPGLKTAGNLANVWCRRNLAGAIRCVNRDYDACDRCRNCDHQSRHHGPRADLQAGAGDAADLRSAAAVTTARIRPLADAKGTRIDLARPAADLPGPDISRSAEPAAIAILPHQPSQSAAPTRTRGRQPRQSALSRHSTAAEPARSVALTPTAVKTPHWARPDPGRRGAPGKKHQSRRSGANQRQSAVTMERAGTSRAARIDPGQGMDHPRRGGAGRTIRLWTGNDGAGAGLA